MAKFKTQQVHGAFVWRISERAPMGEWIDLSRGAEHMPPEVNAGGWVASSFDLLIFDAPAHAGTFFRRVDREVKELPRDLPEGPRFICLRAAEIVDDVNRGGPVAEQRSRDVHRRRSDGSRTKRR